MNEQNNAKQKLTDKAFSRLMWTSVIAILVCIACLCSGTYAWFAEDLSSASNEIKVAEECSLVVTASDDTQTLLTVDCKEEKTLTLEKGVTYTVVLSLPADSASGYLLVRVGSMVYHTDFIERHADEGAHTMTFYLVLAETAEVVFAPRWGIYSGACDVKNGETLTVIPITNAQTP